MQFNVMPRTPRPKEIVISYIHAAINVTLIAFVIPFYVIVNKIALEWTEGTLVANSVTKFYYYLDEGLFERQLFYISKLWYIRC